MLKLSLKCQKVWILRYARKTLEYTKSTHGGKNAKNASRNAWQ